MKETFAGKVRAAMQARQKVAGEFTFKQIAEDLDLVVGTAATEPLSKTLRDFRRRGEIEQIGKRRYVYRGRVRKPEIQRVMWDVLRAQRKATIEDLMMMASASRDYARRWLRMLEKKEIVSQRGDKWVLISDPVEMPRDEEKAAYKRRLWQKKKDALAALDTVVAQILALRLAINDIPEQ